MTMLYKCEKTVIWKSDCLAWLVPHHKLGINFVLCESWYVVDIIFFHMLTEWSFMTLFSILNGLLIKVVFYYTHTSMHIYTLIKQNSIAKGSTSCEFNYSAIFLCTFLYIIEKDAIFVYKGQYEQIWNYPKFVKTVFHYIYYWWSANYKNSLGQYPQINQ